MTKKHSPSDSIYPDNLDDNLHTSRDSEATGQDLDELNLKSAEPDEDYGNISGSTSLDEDAEDTPDASLEDRALGIVEGDIDETDLPDNEINTEDSDDFIKEPDTDGVYDDEEELNDLEGFSDIS